MFKCSAVDFWTCCFMQFFVWMKFQPLMCTVVVAVRLACGKSFPILLWPTQTLFAAVTVPDKYASMCKICALVFFYLSLHKNLSGSNLCRYSCTSYGYQWVKLCEDAIIHFLGTRLLIMYCQCYMRPMVAYQTAEAIPKLYCLVTEAHVWECLAQAMRGCAVDTEALGGRQTRAS